MGNSPATPSKVSREINEKLREERVRDHRTTTILLLGTGNSGKATFLRALELIYGVDDPDMKVKASTDHIRKTCCKFFMDLVGSIKYRDPSDLGDPKVAAAFELIKGLGNIDRVHWSPETVASFKLVRAFKKIQQHLFEPDSPPVVEVEFGEYVLDHLDRIADSEFVPSPQDYIRFPEHPDSVIELEVTIRDTKIKFFDISGLGGEKRKWIHHFESPCLACADENNNCSKFHEPLMLFDELAHSHYFNRTTIVLLLNKKDRFDVEAAKHDLKAAFPDYAGGKNIDEAAEYVKRQFSEKYVGNGHLFISHFVTATDLASVRLVMETIILAVNGGGARADFSALSL